jgi:hypothetical protein
VACRPPNRSDSCGGLVLIVRVVTRMREQPQLHRSLNDDRLVEVLQRIAHLTRLWVDFIRKKPSLARGYEGESRQQHHDLLRAAKSRDLAEAEAILTQHINHARDLLVSHLRQVDIDRAPKRTVPTPAATIRRPTGRRRVRAS